MVAEFRALGGTAANVTLREGSAAAAFFRSTRQSRSGSTCRRIFSVPASDTELRDRQLVVKELAKMGTRERAFFDRYQQEFSWGAGVFDDLWQQQLAWSQLPEPVQAKLTQIGPIDGPRFFEPSDALCLRNYLGTRQIDYRGTRVLMPMVELVNHADQMGIYNAANGIAVAGKFEGEVLVTYGGDDCWGNALSYGFCDARQYALGLASTFRFEDHTIRINRAFTRQEHLSGIALPMVRLAEDIVSFSFLMLGNRDFPRMPRSMFRQVVKKTPINRADEMFDLVEHENRMRLVDFLRVSEGLATPLGTMLRRAAYQQLETLSAYYGTRPLPAGQRTH